MCRDLADAKTVQMPELVRGRTGRARHAGNAVVEAEKFRDRDAGGVNGEWCDRQTLARFDGLVNSVPPFSAASNSPGEFVHDEDFRFVFNDVVDVAVESGRDESRAEDRIGNLRERQSVKFTRLVDGTNQSNSGRSQLERSAFVVAFQVRARFEQRADLRGPPKERFIARRVAGLRADDQRRAGLVDQKAVRLIDQREAERPPLNRAGHGGPVGQKRKRGRL